MPVRSREKTVRISDTASWIKDPEPEGLRNASLVSAELVKVANMVLMNLSLRNVVLKNPQHAWVHELKEPIFIYDSVPFTEGYNHGFSRHGGRVERFRHVDLLPKVRIARKRELLLRLVEHLQLCIGEQEKQL